MPRIPLTKQWLLRTYLLGVVQIDDAGQPFRDVLYDFAIQAAADVFFRRTNVYLLPEEHAERHDYSYNMAAEYHFLKLDRRPILRGNGYEIAVKYKLGQDAHIFDLPPNWILEVIPEAGHIQLLPIARDAGSYPITPSGRWFGIVSTTAGGRIPGWYEVTYYSGFAEGDLFLINDLVNDLTRVHEGHRREVRGDPQVHTAVDTANSLLAHGGELDYTGRTLAEALVQAIAYGSAYNAHLANDTVHGVADTVNVITSDDPTDLDSLVTFLNEARIVQAQHLLETAGGIHGNEDIFRTVEGGPVRSDYVDLPYDIRHCLGMIASLFVLNPAGDLIVGAGIASKNISLDGLSVGLNTTSSATNAGYGARIIQYQKDMKPLLEQIKRYYYGMGIR